MAEQKEPTMAPGQELTIHPGDPVRGADLLAERMRRDDTEQTQHKPDERRGR